MGYQITYPGQTNRPFATVPVRKRTGRFILLGVILVAVSLFIHNFSAISFLPGDPLVTKQAIQCFVTGIRQDMPFLEAAREFCVYIISNG